MSAAKRGLWLWGPVLLYTGFIFWLSSRSRPIPGIELLPWVDKPYHAVEYTPLGLLLSRALRRSKESLPWRSRHRIAFLAAVAVGGLDEIYQFFVPLKESSFFDLIADSAGAAIGQWIYRRRRP